MSVKIETPEELDFAMLELRGPRATEEARDRRRQRGAHAEDRGRARYARRIYGRRWRRSRRLVRRRNAAQRDARLVEALARLLASGVQVRDLEDARCAVRAAMREADAAR